MGSIIQPVNASNIARRIEVTTQARAEEAVTHVLELTQLTLLCQVACGDIEIAIVHSVENSCCNIGHVYGYQRGVLKTRRLTVKTTPKSHSISLEVSARYPRGVRNYRSPCCCEAASVARPWGCEAVSVIRHDDLLQISVSK
jgi:hypothetical protein